MGYEERKKESTLDWSEMLQRMKELDICGEPKYSYTFATADYRKLRIPRIFSLLRRRVSNGKT